MPCKARGQHGNAFADPGLRRRVPRHSPSASDRYLQGQMWRDIGLPEWIFEIEDSDGSDLAKAALLRLVAEFLLSVFAEEGCSARLGK